MHTRQQHSILNCTPIVHIYYYFNLTFITNPHFSTQTIKPAHLTINCRVAVKNKQIFCTELLKKCSCAGIIYFVAAFITLLMSYCPIHRRRFYKVYICFVFLYLFSIWTSYCSIRAKKPSDSSQVPSIPDTRRVDASFNINTCKPCFKSCLHRLPIHPLIAPYCCSPISCVDSFFTCFQNKIVAIIQT